MFLPKKFKIGVTIETLNFCLLLLMAVLHGIVGNYFNNHEFNCPLLSFLEPCYKMASPKRGTSERQNHWLQDTLQEERGQAGVHCYDGRGQDPLCTNGPQEGYTVPGSNLRPDRQW